MAKSSDEIAFEGMGDLPPDETTKAEIPKVAAGTAGLPDDPVGIYVNGTPDTAFFTIMLPDGTCGMFMMPSARDVFWMGFTKYKTKAGKLVFFKVQNENPISAEEFTKVDFDINQLKKPPKTEGPPSFIEATLKPGVEYIQHSEHGDSTYIFHKRDVSYWEKIGGWKAIGIARQLDDMESFDHAHEIRKLCVEIIAKYGNVFIWA